MNAEFEFYLARLYRRPNSEGWLFTVCEIQRFDTDAHFTLLGFGRIRGKYTIGIMA